MIWKKIKKPDPEKEAKWREDIKNERISFKDTAAILISAFVIIILPVMLILFALGFLMMWMFGAL